MLLVGGCHQLHGQRAQAASEFRDETDREVRRQPHVRQHDDTHRSSRLRQHAIRLLEKFYESKVFTDAVKAERRKTFVCENGIYQ